MKAARLVAVNNPDQIAPTEPQAEDSVGRTGATAAPVVVGVIPEGPIRVYVAREIVTMNPSNPTGTHVAVANGRILGVGSLAEVAVWGDYQLDETFADKVIVPGFVEAHSHLLEGSIWVFGYVGRFDRLGPDGVRRPGSASVDSVLERIGELERALAPGEPLICWGFDPIYYEGERVSKTELDRVSAERPIFLMHASLHLATANSAALALGDVTADVETEGVVLGDDGEPNGELREFPAMMLVPLFQHAMRAMGDPRAYWRLGQLAVCSGVTTLTDLGNGSIGNPTGVDVSGPQINHRDYPVRVVRYCLPSSPGRTVDPNVVAQQFLALKAEHTSEHLRWGGIKLVADGSIQGYTAVLKWPGYVNGAPNGMWLVTPEQMKAYVECFHRAGINVHIHANGDATVDAAIDAVDAALRNHAWLDHRHTVQHCQLTSAAQYRRMGRLGMCANVFANHLWYWGDQHYESTVGPERANRLESVATAKRMGVPFSFHSDASVTPLGHLHTMWCVVNRVTPSGRVLGDVERISAYDALEAATMGAAFQMHLDAEIGSIEVGKRADFAILDANPLSVDPMSIRDIGVWGTVLSGVPHQAGVPLGPYVNPAGESA